MNTGLAGKSVVVTGGTSGIGKAAAEAFLAEGCRVTVCDFRQDMIDQVNSRNDPNQFGFAADVTCAVGPRAGTLWRRGCDGQQRRCGQPLRLYHYAG